MGPDAMILVSWILSFKPTFSPSSFTFIKKLFNSSALSAIRVVSSSYLRLLIFFLAVFDSSLCFLQPSVSHDAYKLDKQDDNIQPWRTPFPIWNQSVVPCPVLTVASRPAYRFFKRQVRWSGIPISFITLIQKPKTIYKKLHANIFDEYRCKIIECKYKIFKQIKAKQYTNRIIYYDQGVFILGSQEWFSVHKSVWYTTLTKGETKITWSSQ